MHEKDARETRSWRPRLLTEMSQSWSPDARGWQLGWTLRSIALWFCRHHCSTLPVGYCSYVAAVAACLVVVVVVVLEVVVGGRGRWWWWWWCF